MEWNKIANWIEEKQIGKWQAAAPLAAHTSWKIGGPARLLAWPVGEEEMVSLVRHCISQGYPYRVLGAGTNLLVADQGVDALVIHTGALRQLTWGESSENRDAGEQGAEKTSAGTQSPEEISAGAQGPEETNAGAQGPEETSAGAQGAEVTAGAGVPLAALADAAARRGLSGLEFAAGIPGSLGGALVMNAGAYQGQMSDVVVSVRVIGADGEVEDVGIEDLSFGYRSSSLRGQGKLILSGSIHLGRGDAAQSLALMQGYLEMRRNSQPLDQPSGGSVFRNPEGGGAGRYIDQAGLKGLRVGNAQISPKHANFIVNLGGAKAGEVRELMDIACTEVKARYGVALESEIVYWG
ncbi:MAG: UDP-N-acetylmuramate dehydrogenase [Clostridiales bacterium]|nr:UDP-N-acetylmuramate dehydrogenase [Clostridiales bacterium]